MIRLAFLVFLAVTTPAFATQDGWPALYDVTGVASDDVLNIRSEPGVTGDVIGSLEPDAVDIEVILPDDHYSWGMVNTGEGTGWVSLAYLARQPGQWLGQFPDIRQCFGTEPFWALDVSKPGVQLTSPDQPAISGLITEKYGSASRRDRFVYRGQLNIDDAGPLELSLSLRMEQCSDGMSDRAYGIEVDMLVADPEITDGSHESGLYSGCCSIAPPAR